MGLKFRTETDRSDSNPIGRAIPPRGVYRCICAVHFRAVEEFGRVRDEKTPRHERGGNRLGQSRRRGHFKPNHFDPRVVRCHPSPSPAVIYYSCARTSLTRGDVVTSEETSMVGRGVSRPVSESFYFSIVQLRLAATMEYIYRLPFLVLEVPNLKLKKPSWLVKPSAMVVFSFILFSYFLVTGGQSVHLHTSPRESEIVRLIETIKFKRRVNGDRTIKKKKIELYVFVAGIVQ